MLEPKCLLMSPFYASIIKLFVVCDPHRHSSLELRLTCKSECGSDPLKTLMATRQLQKHWLKFCVCVCVWLEKCFKNTCYPVETPNVACTSFTISAANLQSFLLKEATRRLNLVSYMLNTCEFFILLNVQMALTHKTLVIILLVSS